jgi:hypothetical protein
MIENYKSNKMESQENENELRAEGDDIHQEYENIISIQNQLFDEVIANINLSFHPNPEQVLKQLCQIQKPEEQPES